MITDADVKKLKSTFATKEELEKLDSRTAEGFVNVQEQLSDIKNTLLDMKDYIYGELHSLHIENKVTSTYRPKIEDHEQRISKVESAVFSN